MVSYKNIETGDSMLLNIVLILVVMDNGLVPGMKPVFDGGAALS